MPSHEKKIFFPSLLSIHAYQALGQLDRAFFSVVVGIVVRGAREKPVVVVAVHVVADVRQRAPAV